MFYYVIKVLISAGLIVAISEISKRNTIIGGILASVPLISVISIIWLYMETKDVERISQFSTSVFWLVIPSLSLFVVLPLLLRAKIDFYLSLLISIAVMVLLYYLMIFVLSKFGIKV